MKSNNNKPKAPNFNLSSLDVEIESTKNTLVLFPQITEGGKKELRFVYPNCKFSSTTYARTILGENSVVEFLNEAFSRYLQALWIAVNGNIEQFSKALSTGKLERMSKSVPKLMELYTKTKSEISEIINKLKQSENYSSENIAELTKHKNLLLEQANAYKTQIDLLLTFDVEE